MSIVDTKFEMLGNLGDLSLIYSSQLGHRLLEQALSESFLKSAGFYCFYVSFCHRRQCAKRISFNEYIEQTPFEEQQP